MIEDQLTHKQRLRLESLAQAIAVSSTRMGTNSLDVILAEAEVIERWLKGAPRKNQE